MASVVTGSQVSADDAVGQSIQRYYVGKEDVLSAPIDPNAANRMTLFH